MHETFLDMMIKQTIEIDEDDDDNSIIISFSRSICEEKFDFSTSVFERISFLNFHKIVFIKSIISK